MGRSALLWLGLAAGWGPESRVVLPAFTCESVIAPFRELGCRLDYYDVREDLSVDPAAVAAAAGGASAIVLIHPFGWSPYRLHDQPAGYRVPGAVLIEDVSHAVMSISLRDSPRYLGDAVLAAYRKVLPTPDGAALVLRGMPADGPAIPATVRYSVHAVGRSLRLLTAGRLDAHGICLERVDRRLRRMRVDPPLQVAAATLPSKRIRARYDALTAATVRQRNARRLLAHVQELAGVTPVRDHVPDDVAPYGLPIRVEASQRERVQAWLRAAGIAALHQWPMPPDADPATSPIAARVSREVLTLPVGERYGAAEMDRIGTALARGLVHQKVA